LLPPNWDPVLARCASAIGGLLDAPAALLGRPEVAARLPAAASGRASWGRGSGWPRKGRPGGSRPRQRRRRRHTPWTPLPPPAGSPR